MPTSYREEVRAKVEKAAAEMGNLHPDYPDEFAVLWDYTDEGFKPEITTDLHFVRMKARLISTGGDSHLTIVRGNDPDLDDFCEITLDLDMERPLTTIEEVSEFLSRCHSPATPVTDLKEDGLHVTAVKTTVPFEAVQARILCPILIDLMTIAADLNAWFARDR
jgi:hypothetical protein